MIASLIPAPYRLLALALLIAAAISFGWVKGAASVQRDWDLATAQAERDAAHQLATTITRVQQRERAAAEQLALAAARAAEEKARDQAARAAHTARLRAGTERLSVPVILPACSAGDQPQPAATASGGHAAARADLPGQTAADLVELAGEADDVVRQLQLLQRTLITYRQLCQQP